MQLHGPHRVNINLSWSSNNLQHEATRSIATPPGSDAFNVTINPQDFSSCQVPYQFASTHLYS